MEYKPKFGPLEIHKTTVVNEEKGSGVSKKMRQAIIDNPDASEEHKKKIKEEMGNE